MAFVLVRDPGAEEAVVALLQEVVGRLAIAGHPREVGPDPARRAVVESAEGILVHLERQVELAGGSFEVLHVRERQDSHDQA